MGSTETFLAARPRLFGIAYRMTGTAADAEDIVQEAFLRWQRVDEGEVESPPALLASITTRLSIDHLRSARVRHEDYVGPWLPEPLITTDDEPGSAAEQADSLSMAFLLLLEELSPAERAAFLLHDVFGYGYAEIAGMLQRQEPACRQLVTRARNRIQARRRRFDADPQRSREIAERFVAACAGGDLPGLMDLFAEDVVLWGDGGGKVQSALRPIVGRDKAARFLAAVAERVAGARIDLVRLNGQPGVLVRMGDTVVTAIVLDLLDGLIVGVRAVTNPDKLRSLA